MGTGSSKKAKLRADVRERLRLRTADERLAESRAAALRLRALDEVASTSMLLLFRALPDELDVWAVAEDAWRRGAHVAVPFPCIDGLEFRLVAPDAAWRRNHHGYMEPCEGESLTAERAAGATVLVPALALTVRGERLGRGAAYYDRALAGSLLRARRAAIGVVSERQIVDDVFAEPHDVGLDLVVTDARTIRTA